MKSTNKAVEINPKQTDFEPTVNIQTETVSLPASENLDPKARKGAGNKP